MDLAAGLLFGEVRLEVGFLFSFCSAAGDLLFAAAGFLLAGFLFGVSLAGVASLDFFAPFCGFAFAFDLSAVVLVDALAVGFVDVLAVVLAVVVLLEVDRPLLLARPAFSI